MSSVERSDEAFTAWMHELLDRGASMFGLTVTGAPVLGWCLRSISGPADGAAGPCWLRVCTEHTRWLADPAEASVWTGNLDANAIVGIARPHVVDWTEWDAPEQQRRVRAEVMTRLPGRPCSPTGVLPTPIDLPRSWWTELRRTLNTLRQVRTSRFTDQPAVSQRARDVLGVDVHIHRWETVHGDLHWANLLRDPFGVIDWELWGRGPAGYDAATLYLHSLATPAVAAQVHDLFAEILDSPDGHRAQLIVAARLLHRATRFGDHPHLTIPLRTLTQRLLARPA